MVRHLKLRCASQKIARTAVTSFWLFLSTLTTAYGFTVTVDRQVVPINETIRLEITSTNGDNPDAVNLTLLEEKFTVVKETSQNSISIFNGRTDSIKKRVVIITPQEIGKTSIPPLTLNKQQSQAIDITVIKAAPVPSQMDSQQVMLEAEIDQMSTVVGAQTIYTLRIIYQIQLNNAEISPLSIADADIVALDNKNYTRRINGSNFDVTEKRYAIFFNRPGMKTIDGQQLTALTTSRNNRLLGYDPFSRGKELRLKADAVNINVLAKPADADSSPYWLPSSKLTITSSFDTASLNARVGEPISRSIEITAEGLAAEKLPFTLSSPIDSLNSYAEKPEFVNQTFDRGIAGRRKDTVALIPTVEGKITLPAIEVRWWDTSKHRFEVASIEPQVINVLPAINKAPNRDDAVIPPSSNNQLQLDRKLTDNQLVEDNQQTLNPWMISTLVLALGWLYTYHARANKNTSQLARTELTLDENIERLKRELLLACKQDNPLKAKQALTAYLSYHKECMSKDSSIKALTCDTALKNAMEALDYYLYADHKLETNDREKTPWNGQALKSAVENTDAQSNQQPPSKKILAPLYPE